jgi:hypothetical protein
MILWTGAFPYDGTRSSAESSFPRIFSFSMAESNPVLSEFSHLHTSSGQLSLDETKHCFADRNYC